jgi:hypothetical protein
MMTARQVAAGKINRWSGPVSGMSAPYGTLMPVVQRSTDSTDLN